MDYLLRLYCVGIIRSNQTIYMVQLDPVVRFVFEAPAKCTMPHFWSAGFLLAASSPYYNGEHLIFKR